MSTSYWTNLLTTLGAFLSVGTSMDGLHQPPSGAVSERFTTLILDERAAHEIDAVVTANVRDFLHFLEGVRDERGHHAGIGRRGRFDVFGADLAD